MNGRARQEFFLGDRARPLDLASAYVELHHLILDGPSVEDFLRRLCEIAAEIVPGTHCGIMLRRDDHETRSAGSDEIARQMDEVTHLRGRGPNVEAMLTARRVHVPDVRTETRWAGYGAHALTNGIHSVLSLPLVVGESTGALGLFGDSVDAFAEADMSRVGQFAEQAAIFLTVVLQQADERALHEQLREALSTRALIDQALGIVMYLEKIGASDAFAILRKASQDSNRKVTEIAAEIVESMTGHAPEPPRPLSTRP